MQGVSTHMNRPSLLLTALGLVLSSTTAANADESECRPRCRSGYVCVEGACVSECNPPCADGESCGPGGECRKEESSALATGGTHHRSEGMLIAGCALTGLGGLMLLTGFPALIAGSMECDNPDTGESEPCLGDGTATYGLVGTIGGGLLVAVGIPLIVVGAKSVPNEPGATAAEQWTASLELGPVGLRLRGSF